MSVTESDPFSTYVFFDLETTGIRSPGNNPKITELCFLALTKGELLSKQSNPRVLCKLVLCFNPRKMIGPTASGMTGLHNDSLELLGTFKGQASVIGLFLSNLPQPVCLLAHNGNRFDFPLLKAELERASEVLPCKVYCADTLEAFRMLDGLPRIPDYFNKNKKEKSQTGMNTKKSNTRNPIVSSEKKKSDKNDDKSDQIISSTKAKKRLNPENSLYETPTKVKITEDSEETWEISETTPKAKISTTKDESISRLHSKQNSSVISHHGGSYVRQLFKDPSSTSHSSSEDKDAVHSLNSEAVHGGNITESCPASQEELLAAILDAETKMASSESGLKAISSEQDNSSFETPGKVLQSEDTKQQVCTSSNGTYSVTPSGADGNRISEKEKNSPPATAPSENQDHKTVSNKVKAESIYSRIVKGHAAPPQVSYKLAEVYARCFGQHPEVAHTAEDDCVTMLKIVQTMADKFISWCECKSNTVVFDLVEPMY